MLKLVPNKSLKLLLVDIKANTNILMIFEMAEMTQNQQKCLILNVVPQVRAEKQILLK